MTSSIDTIGWEVKPPDVEPETIVVPGAHVNVGFGLAWGCTWVPMPADEESPQVQPRVWLRRYLIDVVERLGFPFPRVALVRDDLEPLGEGEKRSAGPSARRSLTGLSLVVSDRSSPASRRRAGDPDCLR